MPKITRTNPETHRFESVEVSQEEYEEWKASRATAKSARTRTTPRKTTKRSATVTSEPLEDAGPHTDEPTGPKRKGGPNTKPESILAPALPRLAQALAQLTYKASHTVTGGRAPMTAQEAGFVAIPAVRILDRTAGKYIKATTGVVTPNQEDTAVIVVTVAMWLLGWLIAVLTGKPRTANGPQVAHVHTTTGPLPEFQSADLFSGSEPAGPAVPRNAPAPAPAPFPAIAEDDGDLFSGSEPLTADAQPVAAAPGPRTDPRTAAISEAVWAAISPTDRGEALAG